ncbi:unnamed protein product [Oppiella nova]|uniref:SLC41A/MgtE integral membrane domain-containing protein n=1 Tax=Oppiella nova TaxID=334625 RepID=A0A7R9MCH3_9ACAR|nr:unnamed protein product [Oppiella nova]CAG2173785.1 unnamed protein product [Oppiella nova]
MVILVAFLLSAPITGFIARRNRYTRSVILTGWTPILGAVIIEQPGGLVMENAFDKYDVMSTFQPLVNGIGSNLVGIQTSRLSTFLHQTSPKGKLPKSNPRACIQPFATFLGSDVHSRMARLLLFITVPAHFLYLVIIRFWQNNFIFTIPFVLAYMVAVVSQVAILLYLAYVSVLWAWKRHINPDNSAIPFTSALADVLGNCLMAAAFTFLNAINDPNAMVNEESFVHQGLVGNQFVHQGLVGHNRIIGRSGHLVHAGGLVAAQPALHVGHAIRTHAVAAAPAFAVAAAPAFRVAHAAPVGLAVGGFGLAHGHLGLAQGHLGLRAAHVGHVGHVQNIGPVTAAIETRRTHQVVDVPTSQDVIQPSTLIVEPNILPVNIEFRSQSSPVNVNQVHIPGRPGEHQATRSEEEPDRLLHEVVKPVIQEVRETIVPFRRITQEILPVQEEVQTVVARGERQQVIAQPQVVAQPVAVAQRVAVAAPVAVAQPAFAVAQPIAVAQPAFAVAAQPALAISQPIHGVVAGRVGLASAPALAHGGLITTGISRFGGVVANGGLIRATRL